MIEKKSDFEAIIGEKINIDKLPANSFVNPFVIAISPIFLQGLCSKLATRIISTNTDPLPIQNLAKACIGISKELMKIVSKFASYTLEYDATQSTDSDIDSDIDLVKQPIIALNRCVSTTAANIQCPLYEKILEFLSIFFEQPIIDAFKRNTTNKLNTSSAGSTVSTVPRVSQITSI